MVSVLVEHLSQDVRCRRSKHTCSRASTCFGARQMQRIILWPAACATTYTIASNGLYIPESMSRYYDTINPWSSNSEMPLAKPADAESSCEATERQRNASRPADLFWAGQLLPHDTISRVHLLVQRRAKAHVGELMTNAVDRPNSYRGEQSPADIHARSSKSMGSFDHSDAHDQLVTVLCTARPHESKPTSHKLCTRAGPSGMHGCRKLLRSHRTTAKR